MSHIASIAPSETANVMLLDPESQAVHVVASYGYPYGEHADAVTGAQLPLGVLPLAQAVIASKQVTLVEDTERDPRWRVFPATAWIRSSLSVPITTEEQVLGIINLDSPKPGYFTTEHRFWLEAYADQVAVALQNARLHEALHQEHERLQTILNATTDGIFYAEAEHIRYANERLAAMIGEPVPRLLGQRFSRHWRLGDTDLLLGDMRLSLARGQTWVREVVLRVPGRVPRYGPGHPVPLNHAQAVVGILRDLSTLQQAQRRQVRFITHLAHELRTPLTNLSNRLYLLRQQPQQREVHLASLENVQRRLTRLVEDMQQFFRLDNGDVTFRRGPLDLVVSLKQQMSDQDPLLVGRQVQLSPHLPPPGAHRGR
ncbi:MAG: GAF domain-containing protein [Anaerolineae bacterium]|nr:GAF domain-containing protein [Anaerolineae bacterium]